MTELIAEFSTQTLNVDIDGETLSIETGEQIAREYVDAEVYDGEYTVVPATESQTLATQNKRMTADVLVEEIPYYETTNPSGGYTVIIG